MESLCYQVGSSGAPGEIRTPDPLVRSQMLYPAELRARGHYLTARRLELGRGGRPRDFELACGTRNSAFSLVVLFASYLIYRLTKRKIGPLWTRTSAQVFENFTGGICARGTGNPVAGMRARAAKIQSLHRRPIPSPAKLRPHGKNLIEREFTMERMPAR